MTHHASRHQALRRSLAAAAIAIGLALGSASAQPANIVQGSIWLVPDAIARNAIPANVPGTTPDVTFSVNSPLAFSIGESSADTVGAFLASGGTFGITENTAGALTTPGNNTLWLFEGLVSVVNGQKFNVTHDDGLTLIIGGLDLGFNPGPTAPVTTEATYTGPTGTFAFTLVYGECCAGPAVLQVDLPFVTPVPEPATLALFGTGMLALAGLRRRRNA